MNILLLFAASAIVLLALDLLTAPKYPEPASQHGVKGNGRV